MVRHRRQPLSLERLEARALLAAEGLVISEFMAANDTVLQDEDGEYPDWIELHNAGDQSMNLRGWSLTDDADRLDRWQFPSLDVPAGGYQIVFASGKDRALPEAPLHTNFRLDASGEFLGLADPQGVLVQSFGGSFPPQKTDVAFGLPVEQTRIVAQDSTVRYRIPTVADAEIGSEWTHSDWDASDWRAGPGGFGYDRRLGYPNVGFEEGDLSQWQTSGETFLVTSAVGSDPTQGTHHALLPATESSVTRFSLESFLGLDRFDLDGVIQGTATRGSAIKREFTVQAGAQLELDWNFLTDEPSVGGSNDFAFVSLTPGIGAVLLASVGDVDRLSETAFDRETGDHTFRHTFSEAGTFALGVGVMNETNRFVNSGLLLDNVRIDGVGSLRDTFGPLIETDVADELADVASSLWLRHDFTVAEPSSLSALVLRTRYDDGLMVWLNGQTVAEQNAPTLPSWDALAPQDRPDQDALIWQDQLLSTDDLITGQNTLALQGFKQGPDDPNVLLQFEVIGLSDIQTSAAYLTSPSPGGPNLTESFLVTDAVQFSAERGFYEPPLEVVMTTATPGATIRYTLDGSVPTAESSPVYTEPIDIDRSTVLRAVAFRDDLQPSRIGTRSYLFVENVIAQSRQDALQRGFPATWGPNAADYGMDQRVIGQDGSDRFGGRYANTVRQDLVAIPSLSLVMEMDDLFGPQGIYANPTQRGIEWERPTSVELIYPDGRDGFQVDAGLRIQGGISRYIASKNSLRLLFKEEYGPAKLDFPLFGSGGGSTYDSISLRSSSGEHLVGIHYIRDEFLRRSQLSTGHVSSRGNYMHLYINGLYWGMYNPVERIDGQFAANYFGGTKDEYDVLNAGDLGQEGVSVVSGSLDAWSTMEELARQVAMARTQSDKTAAYLRLQGRDTNGDRDSELLVHLDAENFIDYLITNIYARNTDWPIRNYYMIRRRGPDSTGFKFLVWDAEFTLDRGDRSSLTAITPDGPGILYHSLQSSEAFRVDFSDRVQQHFSPGGAYYVNPEHGERDPERPQDNVPAARYAQLAEQIIAPLVPETARWGDEQALQGAWFTRDNQWQATVDYNLRVFFPNRSRQLLDDLRQIGFHRDAPRLSLPDGRVEPGQTVEIEASIGTIYYTLDGSDPRRPDGSIAPTATPFLDPILLTERTTVRTRSLNESDWSAIREATYYPNVLPADPSNLRIVEINYNPPDPLPDWDEIDVDNDQFEFLEIVNLADRPVELGGVQLQLVDQQGVQFTFGKQLLEPGQRVVVPKDRDAFLSRYGQTVMLARGIGDDPALWVYDGRLGNGGERLTLRDANGSLIQQLAYSDEADWPQRADGDGSSLEVIDPLGDFSDPANFRSSGEFGGSPGHAGLGPDQRVVVNEVLANPVAPQADQLELWNHSRADLDLSGWYLSDSNDNYLRYSIASGTLLGAGEYLVLNDRQLGFGLSGQRGDEVYLLQSDTRGKPIRFVDQVQFDATADGVSLGRWPDAQGVLFPMTEPTLGAANSGPRVPEILISEVHFQPQDPDGAGSLGEADVEFIELYNQTSADMDLSAWQIQGDVQVVLPAQTILAAGQTLLLVPFDPIVHSARASVFRLAYGIDAHVLLAGPFTDHLPNDRGTVRLLRTAADMPPDPDTANLILVDEVRYGSAGPWPTDLQGTRNSLQRLNAEAFGNSPSSWRSERRTPGQVQLLPSIMGDVTGDGQVNVQDIDRLCAAIVDGDDDPLWDLDGNQQIDIQDFRMLTRDILRVLPGDANLDGLFNSSDLVQVFSAAEYEDGLPRNSTWGEGDWNCDGDFTTRDFVEAFQAGSYSRTSLAAVPSGMPVALSAVAASIERTVRREASRSGAVPSPRGQLLDPPHQDQAAPLEPALIHCGWRVPFSVKK